MSSIAELSAYFFFIQSAERYAVFSRGAVFIPRPLAGLRNQRLRPNVKESLLCQAEQNRAQRTLVSISRKGLTATPSGWFRSTCQNLDGAGIPAKAAFGNSYR